ncbi:MAG: response regulator [Chloroflexota bacterium]
MGEQAIKVLVVDDDEKGRAKLIEHLRFQDVQVVGESTLGASAYTWADQLGVDAVVVTVQEPVARALRTIEALSVGDRTWPTIAVSATGDVDTVRKAIAAGVRDFVVLPLQPGELRKTIVNVLQIDRTRREARDQGAPATRLGTIVTVFGVKGGIGKSTIASNVATALAQESRQHVALLDLDLQYGDDAVMLDVVPEWTIAEAVKEIDPKKPHSIERFLTPHASRVKLLAAPQTPQAAAMLDGGQVRQVLEMLASTHDYVVVDTSAQIDEISAMALDASTIVLLVVTPEVPCVKRTKAAIALLEESGYSRDKVKLVINRADPQSEVPPAEIERSLNYPVYARIPDDRAVAKGISLGVPVVMSAPKSSAGVALLEMVRGLGGVEAPAEKRRRSWLPFRGRGKGEARQDAPAARDAAIAADPYAAWEPLLRESAPAPVDGGMAAAPGAGKVVSIGTAIGGIGAVRGRTEGDAAPDAGASPEAAPRGSGESSAG